MKRYKKIVFEALEDIKLEVVQGGSEDLIIRARNIVTADMSSKNNSESYKNPPIPRGYKHIGGEWYNGFVIERDSDGSQFVWIPVGSLSPNGTLDGITFSSRFGRRNFCIDNFSDDEYHEPLTEELQKQIESVERDGGFYFSRYRYSREEGEGRLIKGAEPCNWFFEDCKMYASLVENNEEIKSHLPYGAEWDSVLQWLIESGDKTDREVIKDSTGWGNYVGEKTPGQTKRTIITGKDEEYVANHIYDLAGIDYSWTQEKYGSCDFVARGRNAVARRVSGEYPSLGSTGFYTVLLLNKTTV